LLASAVVLFCCGCFVTHVKNADKMGTPSKLWNEGHHHTIAAGIDLTGAIDLKRACPTGWSSVTVYTSVGDVLLTWLVGSFVDDLSYDPQTITVRCKGGNAMRAILDADGRIVQALSTDSDGKPNPVP
jgi:hypothetical protein